MATNNVTPIRPTDEPPTPKNRKPRGPRPPIPPKLKGRMFEQRRRLWQATGVIQCVRIYLQHHADENGGLDAMTTPHAWNALEAACDLLEDTGDKLDALVGD